MLVLLVACLASAASGQIPRGHYGLLMSQYGCPDSLTQQWDAAQIHINPDSELRFTWTKDGLNNEDVRSLRFCVGNHVFDEPQAHCLLNAKSGCPQGDSIYF